MTEDEDTPLYQYDGDKPDVCVRCGEPAADFYDDREDCPSCGKPACELWMQGGIDYHDERGG